MDFFNSIIDKIFPHTCVICSKSGADVCLACIKNIAPHLRARCAYCKKTTYDGQTHSSCKTNNGLDGLWILFPYSPNVRKIIHSAKYNNVRGTLKDIVHGSGSISLLLKYRKSFNICNFLVPIPLSSSRLRNRGYNQAHYLASEFSQILGQKVVEDVLVRIIDTKTQSSLKEHGEKVKNIRGAFQVKRDISGKSIILVDDIWTTGSTIFEACRILKVNGSVKVFGLILAGSVV